MAADIVAAQRYWVLSVTWALEDKYNGAGMRVPDWPAAVINTYRRVPKNPDRDQAIRYYAPQDSPFLMLPRYLAATVMEKRGRAGKDWSCWLTIQIGWIPD